VKIVLLQNINGVGRAGDVKDVSDGYARNFLLPKKLAAPATPRIVAQWQSKKVREEETSRKKTSDIERLVPMLAAQSFQFSIRVGEEGEMFTSVHSRDIEQKVLEFVHHRFPDATLEEKDVAADTKPIKKMGPQTVPVKIGRGDSARIVELNINITA